MVTKNWHMDSKSDAQLRVDSLSEEYQTYINELKIAWKKKNKPPSFTDVYEILRQDQREQIDRYISDWAKYITPFAEAWWKKHGFGIIWPDDNSEPMQLYELK